MTSLEDNLGHHNFDRKCQVLVSLTFKKAQGTIFNSLIFLLRTCGESHRV